jgi:hypothetical protein
MPARAFARLLGLGMLLSMGCSASAPDALPDTSAQQAIVRQYLDRLAAGRYADAWELLAPRRQRRDSLGQFEAAWRSRGKIATYGVPMVWPAAVDEVRAEFLVRRPSGTGGRERWSFLLVLEKGGWRIAEECGPDRPEAQQPVGSPLEVARQFVIDGYGPFWLGTLEVLAEDQFEDGRTVVFRVLNPLVAPGEGPQPTAILLFVRPSGAGWTMVGGGAIGTIAPMDRYAVSCAWTWLRFAGAQPGESMTAAFYCTVEDSRVATLELERVDGGVQRAPVSGRRAVVFPYAWDRERPWPAQQPRGIRLFDAVGHVLDLPTSPVAGQKQ